MQMRMCIFSNTLDCTLASISTVKIASEEPCYKFELSPEIIQSSKRATWEYNEEHTKKFTVYQFFFHALIYKYINHLFWTEISNSCLNKITHLMLSVLSFCSCTNLLCTNKYPFV